MEREKIAFALLKKGFIEDSKVLEDWIRYEPERGPAASKALWVGLGWRGSFAGFLHSA